MNPPLKLIGPRAKSLVGKSVGAGPNSMVLVQVYPTAYRHGALQGMCGRAGCAGPYQPVHGPTHADSCLYGHSKAGIQADLRPVVPVPRTAQGECCPQIVVAPDA